MVKKIVGSALALGMFFTSAVSFAASPAITKKSSTGKMDQIKQLIIKSKNITPGYELFKQQKTK
jgi:hypothetical protein